MIPELAFLLAVGAVAHYMHRRQQRKRFVVPRGKERLGL